MGAQCPGGSTAAAYAAAMEPRGGLLGLWDRFVGPGASAVENTGTLALGLAGALLGPAARRRAVRGPGRATGEAAILRLLAADLWGGAWCNNTAAAARWYGRPGQGPAQHLGFATAHVHPFVLARLDGGRRWGWAASQYGYLLLATALVSRGSRRGQRVLGVLTAVGGVLLDRRLGSSPSAPWFAPVFYSKLLAGHAAGAALLPRDPLAAPGAGS